MKCYLLKDEDFESLCAAIDRDPEHGVRGGSSSVLSIQERMAYSEAHRFYNFLVREWIDKQKES